MKASHIALLAGMVLAGALAGGCESELKGNGSSDGGNADGGAADLTSSQDTGARPDTGPAADSRLDAQPDGDLAGDAAPGLDQTIAPDTLTPADLPRPPDATVPADSAPTPDQALPPDSTPLVDTAPVSDLPATPDQALPPDSAPAGDQTVIDPGDPMPTNASVIYLHHSTGGRIWSGGVPDWLQGYNLDNNTAYSIIEQAFPKSSPYGWENYPYDYWNIWVQNAGPQPYMTEPTLEMLTQQFDVVVFKHCYPVSGIQADTGSPDISSAAKRIENYKLQYAALKAKMRSFPRTRFIVWTGAALTEQATNQDQATRARQFFNWVKNTWDEPADNIFVWDFFELETNGGIYMLDSYAESAGDSHPNNTFSAMAAPLFGQRLVDVIEGRGDTGSLTGQ